VKEHAESLKKEIEHAETLKKEEEHAEILKKEKKHAETLKKEEEHADMIKKEKIRKNIQEQIVFATRKDINGLNPLQLEGSVFPIVTLLDHSGKKHVTNQKNDQFLIFCFYPLVHNS